MSEWNIKTVKKDEYLDEMLNLVKQIPRNVGNDKNLFEIAKSLATMIGEIRAV